MRFLRYVTAWRSCRNIDGNVTLQDNIHRGAFRQTDFRVNTESTRKCIQQFASSISTRAVTAIRKFMKYTRCTQRTCEILFVDETITDFYFHSDIMEWINQCVKKIDQMFPTSSIPINYKIIELIIVVYRKTYIERTYSYNIEDRR